MKKTSLLATLQHIITIYKNAVSNLKQCSPEVCLLSNLSDY